MYDANVSEHQTLRVLIYSDDSEQRAAIRSALGSRPHPDLPPVEFVECATEPVVWQQLDAGGIDLAVLDGEAAPAGGMGVARQMKDELYQGPPSLLVTARPQDAWLATWSRADAVVSRPLDPFTFGQAVINLLQARTAAQTPTDSPR